MEAAQIAAWTALGVAGIGMVGNLIVMVSKFFRTPETANEATRIGNEFLSGLLKDAREERAELRGTIDDLKADGTTKRERIIALESLLDKKSKQIEVLEARAESAARKLARGLVLTLEDILGPGHRLIDDDLAVVADEGE